MKKIVFALLLALLLGAFCAVICLSSMAQETTTPEETIREGYALTEVPSGSIAIGSGSAFLGMAPGSSYYLTADIELSETYAQTFTGKLYGNGHTVTVKHPVFAALNGATVCDLTIEAAQAGGISDSVSYLGALANTVDNSTVVGITNNVTVVNVQSGRFAGGIAGYAVNSTFSYCTNNGMVTAARPGGIMGEMNTADGTLTLQNCINHGMVNGTNQTGGLVSRVENGAALTMVDCANFGTINVNASDGGGIIGKVTSASTAVTFTRCYNSGYINGATFTGGLCAYMNVASLTMTDCHNGCYVRDCDCNGTEHGKVTNDKASADAEKPMGGLIAHLWSADAILTITDCTNSGEVIAEGHSRVGGIAAVMEGAAVTVTNCHNSGDLGSTYYGGGLFARLGAAHDDEDSAKLIVKDCTNSGDLNFSSYAGGIIGYSQYSSSFQMENCSNSGDVTTGWNAAGLICLRDTMSMAGPMQLTDCTNSGNVTSGNTSGGLVGALNGTYDTITQLTLRNCKNTGHIIGSRYVGGLVGNSDVKAFSAYDSRNEGTIDLKKQCATANVGGLVGRTYGVTYMSGCVNTGDVISVRPFEEGAAVYDIYAGGIVGWVAQSGTTLEHRKQTATLTGCSNTGAVMTGDALLTEQASSVGGLIGVSRSVCSLEYCVNVGAVSGTRHVGGLVALTSQNNQSGSTCTSCVVNADVYNSGAQVTDRTQGAGGLICYAWGDVVIQDCTVLGNVELDISGSELKKDQRRALAALVGYTNNANGQFRDNFFAGELICGEGSDCVKVMLANTVDNNVQDREGNDIIHNYSVNVYPLHYNSEREYSESNTPVLTEEEIADGISMADKVMEDRVSSVEIVTCLGVEAPIHQFVQVLYETAMEGHGYTYDCEPVCQICNREKINLTHTYDNDCDVNCNECGAIREIEHAFGPWQVITQATETEVGSKKHTCDVCGFEETQEIPVVTPDEPVEDEKNPNNIVVFVIIITVVVFAGVLVTVVVVLKTKKRRV